MEILRKSRKATVKKFLESNQSNQGIFKELFWMSLNKK